MGIKISNNSNVLSVSRDEGNVNKEAVAEKKVGLFSWIDSWLFRGEQNKELKSLVVEDFKSRAQSITGNDAFKSQFMTALEKAFDPKGRAPLDKTTYEAVESGLTALEHSDNLEAFACIGGEFLTIEKSITHLPPADNAGFSFYDAHDFRKKLEAGNEVR